MDRTLVICGSAGRGGVTDTMCQSAADYLRQAGSDVMVVFLSEKSIGHCTGCGHCKCGFCILDDDMRVLYRLFSESDLLVLTSPLHFSGPSSVLKTVIDRFQVFWFNRDPPHPDHVLALLCAGSDRPNFAPTLSIMKAFAATAGMRWLGHLEVVGTDRTGGSNADGLVKGFLSSLDREVLFTSLQGGQEQGPCN